MAELALVRQRDSAYKVTKGSLDSQALLQQPRKAPPMGRALRILLGLVLMAYAAPVYLQVGARVAVGSFLLMVGLIGVYSLIHIVVSRGIVAFSPGSARSSYLSRCLFGGCRGARCSGLRSDGDSQCPLWKAHRTSVYYLLPPRQA